MTSLVTALIKPHKLDEVKDALRAADVIGLTVSVVQGHGRQGGRTETFRGTEYKVDLVPKVRVEVLCTDDDVDLVTEAIAGAARTGRIGDGKVWVVHLDRTVRIRSGETGDWAV